MFLEESKFIVTTDSHPNPFTYLYSVGLEGASKAEYTSMILEALQRRQNVPYKREEGKL
jgi:hypothetical protein